MPPERLVGVAVVEQLVGDLVEQAVDVVIEPDLRAVPSRVRPSAIPTGYTSLAGPHGETQSRATPVGGSGARCVLVEPLLRCRPSRTSSAALATAPGVSEPASESEIASSSGTWAKVSV